MTTTRIPRPAVQMCVTATTVLARGGSFVTATVEPSTPTKDNKVTICCVTHRAQCPAKNLRRKGLDAKITREANDFPTDEFVLVVLRQ